MQAYERAKQILTAHRDAFVRIAEALLKSESLDAAEIQRMIGGQPLEDRRSPAAAPPAEEPAPAPPPGGVRAMPALPHKKPAPRIDLGCRERLRRRSLRFLRASLIGA